MSSRSATLREVGALPGEDGEDARDEELVAGGSSRRTTRLLLLILLVLVGVLVGYVVSRGHSSPSTVSGDHSSSSTARPTTHRLPPPRISSVPSLIAGDVLVPGLSNGSRVNSDASRVTYTSVLVNTSADPLTVAYPIRLSGVGRAPVSLLYGELVGDTAVMNGLTPQPRLTRIAPFQRVVLWIGLHVECTQWAAGRVLPTTTFTVSIPVVGSPVPATYSFADLFGPNADRPISHVCRSPR